MSITLPKNPQNHYGTQPAVTNLNVGDVLYIGSQHDLEEMTVTSLEYTQDGFIIHTDKETLIATNTTRVNKKGF